MQMEIYMRENGIGIGRMAMAVTINMVALCIKGSGTKISNTASAKNISETVPSTKGYSKTP